MSLDFGAILSRAWKITWENKVLWIFGILAGLGNGGPNFDTRFSNFGNGSGGQPELPPRVEEFIDRFSAEPAVLAAIIGGIICLVILIGLVILALSIIGRGGLIGGVQIAEANGKVTFGEAWQAGLRHFWTLFLIGLLVGVVTLVLGLVTILPGILLTATLVGAICGLPLICVFVIAAIVLGIIAYFAQIAAVLEGLSVMDALRRGWELLRANIAPIIILGIILAVVGGILGFVFFLPILLIVVPVVISMMGFANESQAIGTTALAVAALCCVAYLPVLLVASGVLQTWITSAWTLAYQQLTRPSAPLGSMPAPTIVHPS